jgi:glucose-6-phosphate 1-dehydrogenase
MQLATRESSGTLIISGDLAKKKTCPSLLELYDDNLLPKNTIIYGYARSQMSNDDLRN